jgi:hypothetical protein
LVATGCKSGYQQPLGTACAEAIGYYPAFGQQPKTAWFIAEFPIIFEHITG